MLGRGSWVEAETDVYESFHELDGVLGMLAQPLRMPLGPRHHGPGDTAQSSLWMK